MLNAFLNIPCIRIANTSWTATDTNFYIHPINLPESLSFHSCGVAHAYNATYTITRANTTERPYLTLHQDFSFSFGVYSYTGSTLTLVTSILLFQIGQKTAFITSGTATVGQNSFYASSWMYGEIPPILLSQGNWFLGYALSQYNWISSVVTNTLASTSSSTIVTTALQAGNKFFYPAESEDFVGDYYSGPFYKGWSSTSVSELPVSFHSSSMLKADGPMANIYIVLGS